MNLKKIENILILILWISVLASFPYALLTNYQLFLSDYLGLAALLIVTAIAIFYPKFTFKGLLILLVLGLFNVFSFIYFFNIVFYFGISSIISPSIQLFSLILLIILVVKRGDKISGFFKILFGRTEKETLDHKTQLKNNFKLKFAKLTEQEIEKKLESKLVEEATQALIELQQERKNEL
jgi:CDP-diglyceride synthetase